MHTPLSPVQPLKVLCLPHFSIVLFVHVFCGAFGCGKHWGQPLSVVSLRVECIGMPQESVRGSSVAHRVPRAGHHVALVSQSSADSMCYDLLNFWCNLFVNPIYCKCRHLDGVQELLLPVRCTHLCLLRTPPGRGSASEMYHLRQLRLPAQQLHQPSPNQGYVLQQHLKVQLRHL